ncbi:MAG: hypothetical protein ACKVIN_17340 [Longimicrobiales bacterium]|jgi:hypothetical protein
MNWEALGAIGELVGAGGVIASLIYLAAQVRQGTRATKLDTAVRVMEASVKLCEPLTGSRELSHLVFAAAQGEDFDSPGDRLSAHAWFFATLKTVENAHYLFERGALEAEVWSNWQDWWSYWLRLPGFTEYWQDRRHVFRESFRLVVDGWLETEGPMPAIFAAGVKNSAV